jgi:hypothetical protein
MRAVNLIPAGQRGGSTVGAGRSEGGAYAVLAVCAGLAALALLYGMARRDISSRRTKVATATAQAAQAQAAAGALAPYTNFVSLRDQRTQAVTALVGSRFDWAHAIHELGRVLTAQTSISSLTGTIAAGTVAGAPGAPASSAPTSSAAPASAAPASASTAATTPASATSTPAATTAAAGPAVTSATPPGSVPTFSLVGCATTQPAVAKMLGRLRLIDGVSEVVLQSSTKSAVGSGAAAGGSCPGGDPAFTVLVTFDALPAAPATTASTSTVSNSAGGSAAAATATSPGVSK